MFKWDEMQRESRVRWWAKRQHRIDLVKIKHYERQVVIFVTTKNTVGSHRFFLQFNNKLNTYFTLNIKKRAKKSIHNCPGKGQILLTYRI